MTARLNLSANWRNQHRNLLRLLQLRFIALSGQAIATLLAFIFWGDAIAWLELASAIAFMAFVSFVSYLDWRRKTQISDRYLFAQLMLDLLSLSYLLYFSGGVTNPFMSFFLVPLCIAVSVLPWRYSWVITTYSLIANTILLYYFEPIDALMHHHHGDGPSLHLLGMWLNFICSALIISYFVAKMSQALRLQEQQLNQEVETRLRDEQLLSVAHQAANTAHELGTPLSTITLLAQELPYADKAQQEQDLALLQQQVNRCKDILQQLSKTAQQTNTQQLKPVSALDFVKQSLNYWQLIRPQAQYQLHIQGNCQGLLLPTPALEHALLNLLNNAANACEQAVEISVRCEHARCHITIQDRGPGFDTAVLEKLGQPQISIYDQQQSQGLGLGLMLSIASIERSQGQIHFSNNKGACVSISLPLEHH